MAKQVASDVPVSAVEPKGSCGGLRSLARPGLHVLLVLLVVVALIECATFVAQALAYPKLGYDFSIYFAAALALRDNLHANIYSLQVLQSAASAHHAAIPGALYLYPPFLAVVLIPLALLPYPVALPLWLMFNLLLWLGGMYLLAAQLRSLLAVAGDAPAKENPRARDATAFSIGVCAFLCLTYGPMMQAFQLGQVTMLIFAVVAAVPFLIRAGRDRTAGVLLALATLLKLFPAVLILYFALHRQWRIVVSALVALAATTLALLPLLGLDGLLAAGKVLANGGANAQQFHNQSLARVPLWIAAALGGVPSRALDVLGDVLIVLALAAFIFCVLLTRRPTVPFRAERGDGDDGGDASGYGWAVATMVLVSPILWEHYDAWLLPVMVLCIGAGVAGLTTSHSESPFAHRRVAFCALAGVAAYALTTNALPYSYDGLVTFSPGPYISGHPIRSYFMLLRPLAALLLWIATGALYMRQSQCQVPVVSPTAQDVVAESAVTSAVEVRANAVGLLLIVALAVPAAVIGMDGFVGLVTSLAHP